MKQRTIFTCLIFINITLLNCVPSVTTENVTTSPQPMPEKARIRDLSWKPTMTQKDFDLSVLSTYGGISVSLVSVDDAREDPRLIGKAYEDRKIRDSMVPIATKVNVAKWCKASFEKAFQMLSINSVTGKGKLRLNIELLDFSIFDDFTQTGTATIRVTANNSGDMMIWEGQIRATSDLYVHETQSDGISECLSNTALMVIYNMFAEQSFKDAVMKSLE